MRSPRPGLLAGASRAGSALTLLLAATLTSCSPDAGRRTAPAPLARDGRAPAASVQRRDTTVFAVFSQVARDSLLRGQRIRVRAKDSTLILSGSVSDSVSHERLLAIAQAHLGHFALIDSVRVGTRAPANGAAAPGGAAGERPTPPSDGPVAGGPPAAER